MYLDLKHKPFMKLCFSLCFDFGHFDIWGRIYTYTDTDIWFCIPIKPIQILTIGINQYLYTDTKEYQYKTNTFTKIISKQNLIAGKLFPRTQLSPSFHVLTNIPSFKNIQITG